VGSLQGGSAAFNADEGARLAHVGLAHELAGAALDEFSPQRHAILRPELTVEGGGSTVAFQVPRPLRLDPLDGRICKCHVSSLLCGDGGDVDSGPGGQNFC
jgi:hypothetical protein